MPMCEFISGMPKGQGHFWREKRHRGVSAVETRRRTGSGGVLGVLTYRRLPAAARAPGYFSQQSGARQGLIPPLQRPSGAWKFYFIGKTLS